MQRHTLTQACPLHPGTTQKVQIHQAQQKLIVCDQGAFAAPANSDSYSSISTPATIATSAKLNTYQRNSKLAVSMWKSMKSMTPGQCSRSIALPIAPPMISPSAVAVSRHVARASQTHKKMTAASLKANKAHSPIGPCCGNSP